MKSWAEGQDVRVGQSFRIGAAVLAALLISGCTLPRGAGLESEILRGASAEDSPFSVVAVTRATLPMIAEWPATGGGGLAGWIGAGKGSDGGLIRSGDLVNITIWDNEEYSLLVPQGTKRVELAGVPVSSAGSIFVPYVGEVGISGQTPDQARATIEEKLLTVAPSAQVVLTRGAGKQNAIDLVTGIQRPGTYPLDGRQQTVLSALAEGGGIQNGLRNPIVRLIRGGATYEIPAERLLSDASQNASLRGGDKLIVVSDERYFTSLGATGTERLIHFEKETMTALETISVIGGLADARANPRGVLILRDYPQKSVRSDGSGPSKTQVVFSIDLTSADGLFAARSFRIYPKDTVMATESPVVAAQTVAGLIGSALGLRRSALAE